MNFSGISVAATLGAIVASTPALAGYTITQGHDAPVYTDDSLNFDEPCSPTGNVSTTAWLDTHGLTIEAAEAPQVGAWDLPCFGQGNALRGWWGLYMTFEHDLSALSFQAMDSEMAIYLFHDGVQVGTSPAWQQGDNSLCDDGAWFDIQATDGVVFDEVWVSWYNALSPPNYTYIDNLSWKPAGLVGDEIHAEGQLSWNGSVIESVDTIVGPGSELTFQSTRFFDVETHVISYDVDVTESGVIITLDASSNSLGPLVLTTGVGIVLSDLDFDGGPIGDVSVVQDGYELIDPDTGDPIGGVAVSSDAHSITIHFPTLIGTTHESGLTAGTHVIELEIAPVEPAGLVGDEIHAEGQLSWNGSVIESVDTIVGPGSELTFSSTRTLDQEHHGVTYDVDVTESGVIITLDAGSSNSLAPWVLTNEIDIVLSDLDFDGGPIGDVSVVQDGYELIDPDTGDPMGGVEVSSDAHSITIHFPFLVGTSAEYGLPAGTHVIELEIAPGCVTDLDGDGETGFSDLTQLLAAWGDCLDCAEDLDGDCQVGFADLTELLAAWGPC